MTRTGAAAGARPGASWKSPAAAARQAPARKSQAARSVGRLRALLPFTHRREGGADAMVHREQRELAPSDRIVQRVRRPGGRLAKSPRIIVQRSPASSNSISPRMTSTAAWLLRCACRGMAAPVLPVNVASSCTSPVSAGRAIALHDLTAHAVILAGVRRAAHTCASGPAACR